MICSRRRFLSLTSAACLGAALPAHAYRWQGVALGARTQIILDHPKAEQIAADARAEIARLEGIFSLYQPSSELVRLNRTGYLQNPSFELLDCLTLARMVHKATGGLFDPTVQPLWSVLAEAKMRGGEAHSRDLAKARALIGFNHVLFDADEIMLDAGQALTLNGIAQGYIADRVANRMRAAGVTDVLIDTGEIVAVGQQAGHDGWPVRIAQTETPRILKNRALATSATLGTVLDQQGQQGHILRPDSDQPTRNVQVTVSAPQAAIADAMSTALCLVSDKTAAQPMLAPFQGSNLESYIRST